jgi:hypothetical protein
MDPQAFGVLKRTQDVESTGGTVKTDPHAYNSLSKLIISDPASFQKTDMTQFFDKLSPADRKHFMDKQTEIGKKGADRVVGVQAQIGNTAKILGLKGDKEGIFIQKANSLLYAAQEAKGAPLSQDETQKVLDKMALSGNTGGYWSGTTQYQADIAGKGDKFQPEWADEQIQNMKNAFKRKGLNYTDEDIDAKLRKMHGLPPAPKE